MTVLQQLMALNPRYGVSSDDGENW